jgi:hypothetical protein
MKALKQADLFLTSKVSQDSLDNFTWLKWKLFISYPTYIIVFVHLFRFA